MEQMERKRLTSSEQTAVVDFMAITDRLDQLMKNRSVQDRIRMVPRGWWRLRVARAMLVKMAELILDTVPGEQLTHMKRNLKHVRCWIYIGKQAPVDKDNTDGRFLSINELNTCAEAIKEGCLMCNIQSKQDRRQCKRAKLMDCLPMAMEKGDPTDCGWFDSLGSY